jgi:hypothetical protein
MPAAPEPPDDAPLAPPTPLVPLAAVPPSAELPPTPLPAEPPALESPAAELPALASFVWSFVGDADEHAAITATATRQPPVQRAYRRGPLARIFVSS